MRFGFPVPTCREGRDNLTGFVKPKDIIKLSQECERLGFYAIWGNDFINPPKASLKKFNPPPAWYEIVTSFAAIAVVTQKIKLGIGVIVMPFREPIILTKQVMTVDHFSNGRVLFGLGLGGSRDEFLSLQPKMAKAHRGNMLDEGLEAVKRLLNDTNASFDGQYYAFKEVSLYPRAVQKPLPIYVAGHGDTTPDRIAKYAQGWLVSYPSLDDFPHRWKEVEEAMDKEKRSMSELDVVVSWGMSLAKTREKALERFKKSLQGGKERPADWYSKNNLIGSPAEVAEFISGFEKAGATHCIPLHIAADTMPEIEEQLHMFAEEVMPLVKKG